MSPRPSPLPVNESATKALAGVVRTAELYASLQRALPSVLLDYARQQLAHGGVLPPTAPRALVAALERGGAQVNFAKDAAPRPRPAGGAPRTKRKRRPAHLLAS